MPSKENSKNPSLALFETKKKLGNDHFYQGNAMNNQQSYIHTHTTHNTTHCNPSF